jgi:hypothetical protein
MGVEMTAALTLIGIFWCLFGCIGVITNFSALLELQGIRPYLMILLLMFAGPFFAIGEVLDFIAEIIQGGNNNNDNFKAS